jgi:hypothetical protein
MFILLLIQVYIFEIYVKFCVFGFCISFIIAGSRCEIREDFAYPASLANRASWWAALNAAILSGTFATQQRRQQTKTTFEI